MGQPELLEKLGPEFASAYAIAANAGANMRTVTDALESLREGMTPGADVFALWNAFDEQLGRAGLGPFRPAMSALHEQFKKCAIQQLLSAVADAEAGEPAQGAAQWLLTAARCFGDCNWRLELFTALAEASLPVVQQLESPFCEHATLRQLALCVATSRWVETYDWFRFLARQSSFSDELRARMLVIAAEIQLFCFRQRTRARRLLEEAEKIAPSHPRVMVGWGEWHLEVSDSASLKAAEQYFRKVISLRPRLADGYVNLGDVFERKGDLSATESQFQDAVLNAPGMIDGYLRLLRLFCNGEWFVTRSERRADLRSRMLILDPDESNYLVEEGDASRANRHWAEAHVAYRRAIELAPYRLNARTGLAYAWCDEAQDPETTPQRATECFAAMRQEAERALADFPNAPDAYWIFIWHAEGTKNWDEAIRYSERIGELHPEWESATRFRAAIALRQLGQIDRAEAELHQVLAIEPLHPSAALELNELGEAAYRNGNRAAAERLFAEARRLGGDEAEYDYQNRLGNLHYWHGEYETAADYYRRAIAARPGEAVLHSNLALALEHLHTPGRQVIEWQEILAALTEAARLAPTIAEYPTRTPRDTTPWSWETPLQATRIIVSLGPVPPAQEVAIEADLEAARNSLLEYFGILVPRLEFHIDTALPLHSFQFAVGDREFPPNQGLQLGEIWIAANPSSLPSEWKPRPWTVQGGTAGAVCYAAAEHVRTRFPAVSHRNALDLPATPLLVAGSTISTSSVS